MNRSRTMKLIALVIAVSMVIAPALSAKPKKKRKKPPPPAPVVKVERSETQEYQLPAGVFLNGADVTGCGPVSGCLVFTPAESEEYVAIEVTDQSGTAAPFRIEINGAPQHFCGTTGDSPILTGASQVDVKLIAASTNCPGAASSTGSVLATFSNIP